MDIKINAIHFEATEKLNDFINKKVEKLGKYNEEISNAEVILKVVKPETAMNKEASVRLNVPRSEDLLLIGATELESEDRSPVSLRTTLELLAAAHSAMPALAEARILRLDVNLRPALPDNNPLTEWTGRCLRINGLFGTFLAVPVALLK